MKTNKIQVNYITCRKEMQVKMGEVSVKRLSDST